MRVAPGALVRARGREWVVLPDSTDELLVVRPLGGREEEITGILPTLEPVESATLQPPDPDHLGDHRAGRLLRDAVRLGVRSSAGPFRSFGRINVEPRPYQLVPLLMALRLDPVRLLIADDVGVGKTIETALIARELLDRGEITRLAVLCPRQLAEQWQRELAEKFHIEAELVLPSTIGRLERGRRLDETVFERYPYTIVSTDFIKSERRRGDFLRTCPELVIVDEAHTCVAAADGRTGRHLRYQLLQAVAIRPAQHLVLVTATPHNGKDADFRALLGLLHPDFLALPEDLSGPTHRRDRERLARHFVQRRRADIRQYLEVNTPFPERVERPDVQYRLAPEYRRFFQRVLAYTRETIRAGDGESHRQRVRWWSALALLRAVASSPAAAAETLRARAQVANTETAEDADEVGRRSVLDLEAQDDTEQLDLSPGAQIAEYMDDAAAHRHRLLDLAREAERLAGSRDEKLRAVTQEVQALLADGYAPIIFCRFIPTARFVAEHLRGALQDVAVEAVTGLLPPEEREARIEALAAAPRRVLVATDCLSEGINLQEHFTAVVHYDLAWNPTRHEQREGRVDRYGQRAPRVAVSVVYGLDNGVDGIVLDVLLRKHRQIRRALGVSVPVPADTNDVLEAILEGLVLRGRRGNDEQLVFEAFMTPERDQFHSRWERHMDREQRSRTLFAQHTIRPDEVAAELRAVREAIGLGVDVRGFVRETLEALGARVRQAGQILEVDLTGLPAALRDVLPGRDGRLELGFESEAPAGVLALTRTHPVVEALASYVLQAALDPVLQSPARRAGAIRTHAVRSRTVLLLARFRYHVLRVPEAPPLLAEDCAVLAFEGTPDTPRWLEPEQAEALLAAEPDANIPAEQARAAVSQALADPSALQQALEPVAQARARRLLEAHRRVRASAQERIRGLSVAPVLPADLLGLYVYLPVPRL